MKAPCTWVVADAITVLFLLRLGLRTSSSLYCIRVKRSSLHTGLLVLEYTEFEVYGILSSMVYSDLGIPTTVRYTQYTVDYTEFHGILGSSQALHAFDACNRKASTRRWSCSTSTLFVLRSAGIMTTLCSALIARIRLAWLLEVWKADSSTTRDSSGFCMNTALCRPDPSKPATHVACANIAA